MTPFHTRLLLEEGGEEMIVLSLQSRASSRAVVTWPVVPLFPPELGREPVEVRLCVGFEELFVGREEVSVCLDRNSIE